MPRSILALFLAAFAIGSSEFVIAGILPSLSGDLGVSVSAVGLLISLYALGVAIGGPTLAAFTGRLPRKPLLLVYVAIFTVGYVICAVAPSYEVLLGARLGVSLVHGAYFGTAMVVASTTVDENRRGLALALILSGLTVANVIGVPIGSFVGNTFGWRMTFWLIAALGVLSLAAIAILVPRDPPRTGEAGSFRAELRVLWREPVYSTIAVILLQTIGQFAVFTYIAPLLTDVAGLDLAMLPWVLVVFGLGSTVGVLVGGRLADWNLGATLLGVLVSQVATYLLMALFVTQAWPMVAIVLVWGALSFAFGAPVQARVMASTRDAPLLAASLVPSAFNISIAGGAWFGGLTIDAGLSYGVLPWFGVIGSALAVLVAWWSLRRAVSPARP